MARSQSVLICVRDVLSTQGAAPFTLPLFQSLTCGMSPLDHLILVVGYVSRQAARQEDPNELRQNRKEVQLKCDILIFVLPA